MNCDMMDEGQKKPRKNPNAAFHRPDLRRDELHAPRDKHPVFFRLSGLNNQARSHGVM